MTRRHRLVSAGVACVFVLVSCSDESSGTRRKPEQVPVPQVSLPNGGPLALDAVAWTKLWRTTPGTERTRCVDVGNRDAVRSGQFIVSPFNIFIERWDGTEQTSKLAYIPLHPDGRTSLDVTATRRGTEPPLVVTLHFGPPYSWTEDGMPFYATGTVLPDRGRWQLEAVAGRDRGCFDLDL
jgi:hypothetical protein